MNKTAVQIEPDSLSGRMEKMELSDDVSFSGNAGDAASVWNGKLNNFN